MGEINISRDEQIALEAIDTISVDKLIDQCVDEERLDALRTLRLENCGPFVASRLREYETSLVEYGRAKAAKKRAETESRAHRAGRNLASAIQVMKHRLETEKKDGLLFYVDDLITPPYRFSERVTVTVRYRWRESIEDQWVNGCITFSHDVDLRPDYTMPLPKRKPSAARQAQERQEKLYRAWEHLMKAGLQSVRDYFRASGNGAMIPQSFQARTDHHTQGLNNYSADFWK